MCVHGRGDLRRVTHLIPDPSFHSHVDEGKHHARVQLAIPVGDVLRAPVGALVDRHVLHVLLNALTPYGRVHQTNRDLHPKFRQTLPEVPAGCTHLEQGV